MTNYIIRRLISLVPLLLGITIISFTVIHLAPGKPTDLETQMNPRVSAEARERLEKLYGLDRPLHIQYLVWLGRLVRFDFGRSFMDDRFVSTKILERIPITLTIELLCLIIILIVAIPIGVIGALKKDSLFDKASTIFVFVGFSFPTFWLALLLMELLGVNLGWLPISGIKSLDYDKFSFFEKFLDLTKHLILPVFILSLGGLAGICRYTRANMLEVINQPYIRTARAKGLAEHKVIYKHALRNACLPIVTILGLSIPGLIGGGVIFETIFAIPGMGRLFYDSVMCRDYPVIMGMLVIGAILTLLGNFIADIAYAYVDPRIRYK